MNEINFNIDDFIDFVCSKLGIDCEETTHEELKQSYGLPNISKCKLTYEVEK